MSKSVIEDPEFWNSIAKTYTTVDGFTKGFAVRAWEQANLRPRARVLDIATGNGALASIAAEAGADVLATDFSSGMLEMLRERNANIRVEQMDGQALDLPDQSFDASFSMFGVVLFADWRSGLAEMARVVVPGGTVVVGTWAHGGAAGNLLLSRLCHALFADVEQPMGPAGIDATCEPQKLEAELTKVGLHEIEVVEETQPYFVDLAKLEEPDKLFGFSELWKRLDDNQRTVIVRALKHAAEIRSSPFPVPSTALIANARKPT